MNALQHVFMTKSVKYVDMKKIEMEIKSKDQLSVNEREWKSRK